VPRDSIEHSTRQFLHPVTFRHKSRRHPSAVVSRQEKCTRVVHRRASAIFPGVRNAGCQPALFRATSTTRYSRQRPNEEKGFPVVRIQPNLLGGSQSKHQTRRQAAGVTLTDTIRAPQWHPPRAQPPEYKPRFAYAHDASAPSRAPAEKPA